MIAVLPAACANLQVPLLINQFNNNTHNLKLVVFAFGSKYPSVRDNFTEHLTAITKTFQDRGVPVILMTRPPVNPQPAAPLWFNMYNTTVAGLVADAVRQVATDTGAPCLDVWKLFTSLGKRWKVSRSFGHLFMFGSVLVSNFESE
jgi:hypothetical protein